MAEKSTTFFEEETGQQSMGRLLSFITTASGIAIFLISSVIALIKGADIGNNIMNGAIWLCATGIAGKGLGRISETLGQKP